MGDMKNINFVSKDPKRVMQRGLVGATKFTWFNKLDQLSEIKTEHVIPLADFTTKIMNHESSRNIKNGNLEHTIDGCEYIGFWNIYLDQLGFPFIKDDGE